MGTLLLILPLVAAQEAATERPTPTHWVTQHSIVMDGETVDYDAVVGSEILATPDGDPRGEIFYTAYFRTNGAPSAERPIVFSYNGGPGSASFWLHMGIMGPRRVVTPDVGPQGAPPYPLEDNQYTILDAQENELAHLAERKSGLWRFLRRGFLGSHRPLEIAVVDREGSQVMHLQRPFFFVFSSLDVSSGEGRPLGRVARRFGLRQTLVAYGALSALIVTMMGLYQRVVILVFVALRSVQGAAAPILISAAVAPVVAQQHRATLLSLNSLGGRALWGSILLVVAADAGNDVARTLLQYAAISWVLVALIAVTAARVHRRHGPVPI